MNDNLSMRKKILNKFDLLITLHLLDADLIYDVWTIVCVDIHTHALFPGMCGYFFNRQV